MIQTSFMAVTGMLDISGGCYMLLYVGAEHGGRVLAELCKILKFLLVLSRPGWYTLSR